MALRTSLRLMQLTNKHLLWRQSRQEIMRQQSRCSFKSMRSYHHQNSTSTKHPNLNSWSIVGLTLMAASTYKVQQESLDTTQQLNLFKDCLNQRAFVDNRTWILCYFVRQEGQVWAEYMLPNETRDNYSEILTTVVQPLGKDAKSLSPRKQMSEMWKIAKQTRKILYWQVVYETDTELMFEYSLDFGSEYHLFRLVKGANALHSYNYSCKLKSSEKEDLQSQPTLDPSQPITLAANEAKRNHWAELLRIIPVYDDDAV